MVTTPLTWSVGVPLAASAAKRYRPRAPAPVPSRIAQTPAGSVVNVARVRHSPELGIVALDDDRVGASGSDLAPEQRAGAAGVLHGHERAGEGGQCGLGRPSKKSKPDCQPANAFAPVPACRTRSSCHWYWVTVDTRGLRHAR